MVTRFLSKHFVAVLIPLVLAAQASQAFAQAGSTGGTIGKADKSISGGEPEPHASQRAKPATRPAAVEKRPSALQRPRAVHEQKRETSKGSKVLYNPTINGIHVDWCMTTDYNSQCGEASATALCRGRGFSRSTHYDWHLSSPTYRQGEHNICRGNCGALTEVTCE